MNPPLSPLLEGFVTACNTYDANACLACFTGDAVVHDENHTHRGASEIRAWFEDVSRKYRITMTPLDVTAVGGEAILTASIDGTFDGSPIELRYRFTFTNDKISALSIGN